MRNPLRTIHSQTVMRKLDFLNDCIYDDTHSMEVQVALVADKECIWIYELYYGEVWDTLRCNKVDVLYYHLDRLTSESRFHTQDTWYDRAQRAIHNSSVYI